MKLLFIIDSFGSGGAQRQLSLLAQGMAQLGHSVELFNYFPQIDFFRNEFVKSGAKIHDIEKSSGFDLTVLKSIRTLLKKNNYDVALSFLDAPNIYLLLARIGLNVKVVVSERNSFLGGHQFKQFFIKQIFRLSDAIVANSFSQAQWLIKFCKLPPNRVFTIHNGYCMEGIKFSPLSLNEPKDLRLLGIGRLSEQKNIECLISGLKDFAKRNNWLPAVTWVGKTDNEIYQERIFNLLNDNPDVKRKWTWLGERKDISELLACHHALVLPSKYEGLPNVVCEAMFAGKPVICSNVCDNPRLIKEGINGFLFSPDSPEQLAKAVEKLLSLSMPKFFEVSSANRKFAEKNLAKDIMVASYEALFKRLL